jgi:hypothetical protein
VLRKAVGRGFELTDELQGCSMQQCTCGSYTWRDIVLLYVRQSSHMSVKLTCSTHHGYQHVLRQGVAPPDLEEVCNEGQPRESCVLHPLLSSPYRYAQYKPARARCEPAASGTAKIEPSIQFQHTNYTKICWELASRGQDAPTRWLLRS